MLLAMKGHPGSGKSTIARALGRTLEWPVLDKDDIRDCSLELQKTLSSSSSSASSSAASLLNAFSYDVLWRIVETQLQLGLSVIVDCPLSRPGLFQTAFALARLYSKVLVIIECIPGDFHEWKRRLEARAAEEPPWVTRVPAIDIASDLKEIQVSKSRLDNEAEANGSGVDVHEAQGNRTANDRELFTTGCSGSTGWHKPACWEDLEMLIASYNGCWEYDTAFAKKLVVDTTSLSHEAVATAVLNWIKCVKDSTPAVSYLR